MNEKDLHWLAGLLEGEGSFCKGTPRQPNVPSVSVNMKDYDIIKRVADIFGNSVTFVKSRNPKHSDTYRTMIRSKPAIELMILLKPLMGERRQIQIQKAIDSHSEVNKGKVTPKDRLSIFNLKGIKSVKEIAKDFGISHWRVYQIHRGEFSKPGLEAQVGEQLSVKQKGVGSLPT